LRASVQILSFAVKKDYRLLFGLLAAVVFAAGTVCLARFVPGYNDVRQTVSEIGEMSSPVRVPFAMLLCSVGVCILVFALGVRDRAIQMGLSQAVAYFIGFMAIPCAGTGIFAFPHPLHNVFGISELFGYQAPLVLALTWRHSVRPRSLVRVSIVLYVVICIAIVLNLSSLHRNGALWLHVKPMYGAAQRLLFTAWFGWCAIVGVLLFGARTKA
jgi:hypothetical membrane protein